MFKQILAPFDLTDNHRAVLDALRQLARQSGASVTLLHVIEAIPGLGVGEEKRFFDRLKKTATARLKSYARYLARHKVRSKTKVLIGKRAQDIASYAESMNADLVVLAAPSFNPTEPAAEFASLSYKVCVLAQCPVLLVKQRMVR